MRRQEFLLAPGREDARKGHRRTRHGEFYIIDGGGLYTDNVVFLCQAHHGSHPAPENRSDDACNDPTDPSSAKLVYLEAMQALQWDSLQPTWGRVQQKEEMEYEPIVEQVTDSKLPQSPPIGEDETILEEFEGFLDKFDGTVAHVTLTTQSGETLYGEYPAAELKAQGIREGRRFKCWTVEAGAGVKFVLEPIPDRELSEERERQIDEWLRKSLGDDDGPQDDY